MAIEPGRWLKLNPATIRAVPDAPGVFEIANLVRTVVFIGRGEGSLQRRLTTLGTAPADLPASTGGYYVRFHVTDEEERVVAEREAAHRTRHGGHLPMGNQVDVPRRVRLVTRHAA